MALWHSLGALLFLNIASVYFFNITRVQLACVQIVLGFIFASFLNLQTDTWILLSAFGASIVAFLAGNEFDHEYLKAHKAKLIPFSLVSFFVPFVAILAFLYYGAGWEIQKALIASVALAETSIAMVYAVITSRNYGDLGKFVFCALHLTDIMVLLIITLLVMDFNSDNMVYFVALNLIPYLIIRYLKNKPATEKIFEIYGTHLFIFLIILVALSTKYIKALPVVPVFFLGLYSSPLTRKYPQVKIDIKKFGYIFLVPLYFLRAGSLVSWDALISSYTIIGMLFLIKIATKGIPLFYLGRQYGYSLREAGFISSMMSTGLTLGIFITLFAFESKIFTQSDYTMLLCVIVITALLPTIFAESILQVKENK